jgi:hypothetical protein
LLNIIAILILTFMCFGLATLVFDIDAGVLPTIFEAHG